MAKKTPDNNSVPENGVSGKRMNGELEKPVIYDEPAQAAPAEKKAKNCQNRQVRQAQHLQTDLEVVQGNHIRAQEGHLAEGEGCCQINGSRARCGRCLFHRAVRHRLCPDGAYEPRRRRHLGVTGIKERYGKQGTRAVVCHSHLLRSRGRRGNKPAQYGGKQQPAGLHPRCQSPR